MSATFSEVLKALDLERRLSKPELLIASDYELVKRAYMLVGLTDREEIGRRDREGLSDELYAVLTEIFERHLPDAYWQDTVDELRGSCTSADELGASSPPRASTWSTGQP